MTSGGRPLREAGEAALIEQIARLVGDRHPRVHIGIGDDAAVWRPRAGHELVVTTDTLIERVHFRLEWTDWATLGHKALAVNLSDIAAMGALPRLALVDLAVRGTERDRDIAEFYRGAQALARRFGVAIIGGDTTRSPLGVAISVTVIGESPLDGRHVLRRDAARPGDLIGVTGPLGLAAAGLRVLERGLKTLDGNPTMQERYHRPQPRVREALLLRRCGVRAAMDISDGLLGDLEKLCQASGVSAVVDLLRVPVPNAVKWAFPDWEEIALRGGDDYELLFTAPPAIFERVVRAFRRAGLLPPSVIGEIVDAGPAGPVIQLRDAAGRCRPAEARGYDHFRTS
ncbi:thiamine-phosphate kinase [Thermomicrobium sp. 4228-Ro]|uniref:thiamine-phosphate kinase n=1 Tax=Thermomicrobium sp. 4228-Ro TaxID=2993937 RepID=UPI0022494368|nr:thiamine-phosphate kinase [Thermomicrobium sp. 4228-Ro]MCX2726754.1 thiamine-phosphate kinase [Thermomicrobium sp. 4228-Ro]